MVDNTTIIEALTNLKVDTSSLAGESIDVVVVDFYVNRLSMCLNDGCYNAATAYLEKMQTDHSINSSTKLEILHEYQKLTLKEE